MAPVARIFPCHFGTASQHCHGCCSRNDSSSCLIITILINPQQEEGIVHGDLAARNLLVFETGGFHVKVSDFGLAHVLKSETYRLQNKTLPVRWCAPEVLKTNEISKASDVWSFGKKTNSLILQESLYGR